jgi:hypothetical protein
MKHRHFFALLFLFQGGMVVSQNAAETPVKLNTYVIELQDSGNDLKKTTDLLSKFTGAKEVKYSEAEKTYTLVTERELDYNILSGKLQKNFLPLKSIIKEEKGFPVMVDTGNPELDAKNYETKKVKWIQENPEEYKRMQNK